MISNSNRVPQIGFVSVAWTALWVIVSISTSVSLWTMQLSQSSKINEGMKTQSILLTGASHEHIH